MDIRTRNQQSHGKRKNRNLRLRYRHSLTLSDLSIILKHSGRHIALSRLITLNISSHRILDIGAKNSLIEPIDFMMQRFLLGVISKMLSDLI